MKNGWMKSFLPFYQYGFIIKKENMDKEMVETIIKILNKKKMSLSTLLYLISAVFILLCVIMCILPFHLTFPFVDNIEWDANLNDKNLLVNISVASCVIYLITYIIRKAVVRIFQEKSNSELRIIYSNIYTVDDVVELGNSILVLLCIITVFIQFYKTHILFLSMKSGLIYGIILVKTGGFCILHFRRKNLEIIDKVLKQYPEWD